MKEVYESMLGGGFDAVFRSRKAYKSEDWGEKSIPYGRTLNDANFCAIYQIFSVSFKVESIFLCCLFEGQKIVFLFTEKNWKFNLPLFLCFSPSSLLGLFISNMIFML